MLRALSSAPGISTDLYGRENRVAALLNGAIVVPAKYAQVHPLRCDDGKFPADFRSSKMVSAMRVLDSTRSLAPK